MIVKNDNGGQKLEHLSADKALRYVADKADSYRKLSISLGKYPTYISSSIGDGRSPTLSTYADICQKVGLRLALVDDSDQVQAIITE